MKKIYKYQLNAISMVTEISMPKESTILKCELQNDQLFIWAIVETENEDEIRTFQVFATGDKLDEKVVNHINTIFQGEFVWHIFELKN